MGVPARLERPSPPRDGASSDPSTGRLSLALLGGFDLTDDTESVALPTAVQRVVTFVALHDKPVLRGYVAGSLWGDVTDHRASGSLRSALWKLGDRTHALVDVDNERLQLAPDVVVDLRDRIALANRVLDASVELNAEELDESSLSVDLLPDWTEDWVLIERERYHQLRLRALEALCRRLTEMGRLGQAVQAGIAAVAGEPLRESAHRSLIEAHLAQGNAAAALRDYGAFRRMLHTEFGMEPSPAMEDLVSDLKR